MKTGNEPAPQDASFKAIALEALLREINVKGGYSASVLATADGLSVAVVPPVYDSEIISAMVALVRGAIERAQTQLNFARVDEVSAVDDDRIRLVCRYFEIEDEPFILAVIVPPEKSYRQLTNQAIRRVRQVWSQAKVP